MTCPSGESGGDSPVDTVGVVGAGRIGQWFTTKLTRDGYDVVVSDIDPEAVADAVERGATAGEHPADVTERAEVIVIAVPTKEDVETVIGGDNGILETLEAGQIVIETGTTPPDVDVQYQKICQERDAGYLDSPLTRHGPGEPTETEEPSFTMFVGGNRTDYVSAQPVIESLSHDHEFFEGVGNGHIVKAGVVLRATCRAVLAAEVCEFLANNGVEPGQVIELLDWDVPSVYADPPYFTNRGFNRATRTDEGDTEECGVPIDDRGTHPRLRTSSWAKDSAYALAVAHASNTHVPMLTAAYQMRLLTENYGSALVDRDVSFGDSEWRTFHLRSMYRALNRPQEEWRRLSRWDVNQEA